MSARTCVYVCVSVSLCVFVCVYVFSGDGGLVGGGDLLYVLWSHTELSTWPDSGGRHTALYAGYSHHTGDKLCL